MNTAMNATMDNVMTIRVSQPSIMATIREYLSTLKGVTIEAPAQETAEPEIKIDWAKAHRLARENTKYNEDGLAVLEIGDEWRDEDIWDEYYEELLAKGEIKEPIA